MKTINNSIFASGSTNGSNADGGGNGNTGGGGHEFT